MRTWHLLNWSIWVIFHFMKSKWFSRGNIQPTIHYDQPIWTVQATSSRHLSACRRIFFRILTATSYELHLLAIIVSKEPQNLCQKTYLIAVLNKMGHPNSLSSLNYCNIYWIFIHIMICLRWCYSKTEKWQILQFFIFYDKLDKFEMTSLNYHVFMVIVIIYL